ncbi:hypothetical protein AMAG_01354 [Allomyces macrogynus ATCC 38327]|uniref:Mitochondrial escape protein 2 n=1 Tax=Allomyces macrogynus (strain ATCC 38327) TaxID=578462 RepID=A0A0L0RYN9_ALLM3|nr:hypothetical protein AMAG_01354 [Allomyces macrogynus ATCC 38327]|eukprot:KNE55463.1 hypothetical protein AMAG_01354 [Allomyces macrogynus ATCC 38327]
MTLQRLLGRSLALARPRLPPTFLRHGPLAAAAQVRLLSTPIYAAIPSTRRNAQAGPAQPSLFRSATLAEPRWASARPATASTARRNATLATPTAVLADPEPAAVQQRTSAVLYLDNLFPIKLGRWDPTSAFVTLDTTKLQAKILKMVPSDLRTVASVSVDSVNPRLKDGGAFATVSFDASATTVDAVTNAINAYLAKNAVTRSSMLLPGLGRGFAHPVRGMVFNEDIAALTPSIRLKVDTSEEVPFETIYSTYRPFGEITDIKYLNPKTVTVQFKHMRAATSARNCTYALKVNGATLKPAYEKLIKTHHIMGWMTSHPRIVVPLVVALLVTIGVYIFDPIHVFFVESKATNRFKMLSKDAAWLQAFPKLLHRLETFLQRLPGLSNWEIIAAHSQPIGIELDDFNGGDSQVPRLQSALYEAPDALLVIAGPSGCGKSELAHTVTAPAVDHARIVIDCDAFVFRAHTDADVIRLLAAQVGYWPVFHSLNKLWNYVDVALTAATGTKTGMSVSNEAMVKHILETVGVALTKLGQERKPHEPYPVVVLDNFLKDKAGRNLSSYYDILAQWAGWLVENGIAHVVVVGSTGQRGGGEVGVLQALGRALPTKTVQVVTLTDMPADQAERYLSLRLAAAPAAPTPGEMKQIIATVGGRATDLAALVNKLLDGKPVADAIEELVQKAVLELQKHGFHAGTWTTSQFWHVARQLDAATALPFDKLRFSTLFNGNAAPLLDMERAELLAVEYENGRPAQIRLNKPLYATALARLRGDKAFSAAMDVTMFKDLIKTEGAKIRSYEDEYTKLAEVAARTAATRRTVDKAVDQRLTYLADMMAASQAKVQVWTTQLAEAKKAL